MADLRRFNDVGQLQRRQSLTMFDRFPAPTPGDLSTGFRVLALQDRSNTPAIGGSELKQNPSSR